MMKFEIHFLLFFIEIIIFSCKLLSQDTSPSLYFFPVHMHGWASEFLSDWLRDVVRHGLKFSNFSA